MNVVFFEEEAPAEYALRIDFMESIVFVVGVDMNVRTSIEHRSNVFESFDEQKHFICTSGVAAVSNVEFLRE